jgi:NodT family efflux transporter outer membrane factor (OMF) lipoprotein
LSLLLLPLLGACAAGRDYRAPSAADLAMPDAYRSGAAASPDPQRLGNWWRQFNDPVLDTLVDRAIAGNLDLAQAVARVRQAREAAIQAGAAYAPTITSSSSAGRNFSNRAPDSSSVSGGLDANWEIDLFGGIGRSVEAARADEAASRYSLADVRVSIIAETVSNYIQARLAQERLRIARDTLRTQDDNDQIARWRVLAGLASSLDEEQARSQRAQTAATIPTIEESYRNALNRIAVLTGAPPGEATRIVEAQAPIPQAGDAIAIGVPADTLRQRPDVRGAERSLAAATARIGVAQADLLPALRITGDVGTSARRIGNLADVITGSLFGTLSQLIFDGGAARSRVRAQRAATQEALARYRQSVLTALEDVENGTVAITTARERQAQYAIALEAATNSAIIARSQYQAGLTDFQTLLETERSLLNSRDGEAGSRADRALAIVQLYRALGGGWQTSNGPTS